MPLSEVQKFLIRGLKIFGVSPDTMVGIMLILDSEDLQFRMLHWMSENTAATEPEIFSKAVELKDLYQHIPDTN